MLSQHQTSPPLIQRSHRARILVLAVVLGLGATAAIAASPSQTADTWADDRSLPAHGHAVDATAPHLFAPTQSNIATTTLAVSNCNDTGSGSLRNQIAQAADNDVIDLSQLDCSDIELTSGTLQVNVNNLVIKGSLDSSDTQAPQRPRIRRATSAAPFRIFSHAGTGKLLLTNLHIASGQYEQASGGGAYGGCIRSSGSVSLVRSAVLNCSADSMGSSFSVFGGGIYAVKKVTLDKQSLVAGNTAKGSSTRARGGGIYSQGATTIVNGSVLRDNQARGGSAGGAYGRAEGGGVYAAGGLVMLAGELHDNKATGGGDSGGGGAFVPADEIALIVSSVVRGNRTSGGSGLGGGLYLGDSKPMIHFSTIDDNTTNNIGGGIYAPNGLELKDSSVTGNDGSSLAGGILASGRITIERSTIANNTSVRVAGASLGHDSPQGIPPILIEQSTISGNKSYNSTFGGGLALRHDAIVRNSTITGNVERNNDGVRYGAGITMQNNRQFELSSNIISGNSFDLDGTMFGSDIGFFSIETGNVSVTGSHNLIGNVNPAIQFPGDTMFLPDPLLGPLQDNGGVTRTHMSLVSSSTIDNGKANGFTTDQRGSGYTRVIGIFADIGAVEYDDDRIFYNGFE